ncbi:MAG: glycine--tRNA ligase [Phycisphaerales bacterium]
MSDAPAPTSAPKSMDAIMALCKRRGFIFQASDIYGGINGFWDYGPLGSQMKKNLREAWWQDMIMNPAWGKKGPNGERVRCVPVETRIIQHPKVWEASGHVGGFNDPMVDCRETKQRYRFDHVSVFVPASGDAGEKPMFAFMKDAPSEPKQLKKAEKAFGAVKVVPLTSIPVAQFGKVLGPDAEKVGTLTEPRQFNLMFSTHVGATASADDKAYLRPETAQGIFVQFKNVVDSTRVKIPFGIGNTGMSFRNEVTPRNLTFRSREFEQAELEFFCHPSESQEWYQFWRDFRMEWWQSIGLRGENLILREHAKDELSHYSCGTSDVEYRFPFTAPGFGELEGIAHRGDYDLTQHAKHSGAKLEYFDQSRGEKLPNGSTKGERYMPHCIEPAAGLDRGVLALLCEAYTVDQNRPSPELMKFHPRIAPIKAAVFPLVDKDGMPEVAEKLYDELFARFGRQGFIEMDAKQSIGKRYARMDEAGCPFCFTIDGQTLTDQTVTCRDRDTGLQQRLALSQVGAFLAAKLGG